MADDRYDLENRVRGQRKMCIRERGEEERKRERERERERERRNRA